MDNLFLVFKSSVAKAMADSLRQTFGLPAEALGSNKIFTIYESSVAKAMADSLRQTFGLPAEALAKAGGDGGSLKKNHHISLIAKTYNKNKLSG